MRALAQAMRALDLAQSLDFNACFTRATVSQCGLWPKPKARISMRASHLQRFICLHMGVALTGGARLRGKIMDFRGMSIFEDDLKNDDKGNTRP